ncbi:hypothetical protein ACU8KH_03619 [Lachancea thermotolerans]
MREISGSPRLPGPVGGRNWVLCEDNASPVWRTALELGAWAGMPASDVRLRHKNWGYAASVQPRGWAEIVLEAIMVQTPPRVSFMVLCRIRIPNLKIPY